MIASPMLISTFALSTCSVRHVPATKFVQAGDEVAVSAGATARQAKPCADAALYRRMALKFRKSEPGQDQSLLVPLREEVVKLAPTRCGALEGASGADARYDFALAEYRVPADVDDMTRFVQIVRTDKRGSKREMIYFREYPGDIDSRMAVKAVCDFDGDGFPDVAVDICGPGGCGSSVLLLRPKTGSLEIQEIAAPPTANP